MSAYTPAVLGEDLAVAALAGYLGTKAMEPVSMKLYELESEADRAREDTARPGAPYRIAAEKLTALAGLHLSDSSSTRWHWAFTTAWRSPGPRSTGCCAAPPGCTRSWPGWLPGRR